MLRAFDANGNVIYQGQSPINYQQQCITPEQQFAINMQIYKEKAAARGIDMSPISQQQSQQLSYNNMPPPIIQGSYQQYQPMCSYMYPPGQQQAQQFLQQEYNNRIGGMSAPIAPYYIQQQPQQGMQNGLVSYGVANNGDHYLINNVYGGGLQQQQQLIAAQKEQIRIQTEVLKKVCKAAHTYLERPITDEQLDEMFNPKPQVIPTYEEQLAIQNDQILNRLTQKIEYMELNNITEYEYNYMTAPTYMKQRIDMKNKHDQVVHEQYMKMTPKDMSLADFLNGPANDLYYDSLIIEMRNQREARRMEYDRNRFRSYAQTMQQPSTVYVNLPDHLKRNGPSVVEALGVDDSWFTPEADKFRAEVREALDKSGFNDPNNYERRKLAFFEAVRNGR